MNAPARVLAIDPGISGAVCCVGRGKLDVRRDFKSLADIAQAVSDLSGDADSAVVEFVHSRPGEGTVSVFSFGRSTGVAFGSLLCSGYGTKKPLVECHPIKWQNFFRSLLGIQKGEIFDSRAIATKLLPGFEKLFSRKKDHGTADAVLIALHQLAQGPQASSSVMSPRLLQNTA